MGRFNLLYEPWINVVVDNRGTTMEVSLLDIFKNTDKYLDLAGDTNTQDFAVLRVLVAVLHAVLSRFDADGNVYDCLEVDENFKQIDEVDELDVNDYKNDLAETWETIWNRGVFPEVICVYLKKWEERFFLFDKKFPFFQVKKEDIKADVLNKSSGSEFTGKTINRLISESGNKKALFSPKNNETNNLNKDILTEQQIARWLITLQGYVGLSDKVIFGNEKYKASKGWLFDIGGIYLKGSNLFETLMLNCFLDCEYGDNLLNIQRPSWEMSSSERIDFYLKDNNISNLAELYTTWSRAVFIEPDFDMDKPFVCEIVKLPEALHRDNFLEPMSLWHFNENGENKGAFTPKKHIPNQQIWRLFGLITLKEFADNGSKYRCPGIIDHLKNIKKKLSSRVAHYDGVIQGIVAISMIDDGNATSWLPIDESFDFLTLKDFILTDVGDEGWTNRINLIIQKTKKIVEKRYKNFLRDINDVRGIKDKQADSFILKNIESSYFEIDKEFRKWLISIDEGDDKDKKEKEWNLVLKGIMIKAAKNIYKNGGKRDFTGIEIDNCMKNIATAYNKFMGYIEWELR